MAQTNDCVTKGAIPGRAQYNDSLYLWLVSKGATPGHINDMMYEVYGAGQVNDEFVAYAKVELAVGDTYPDLMNDYFCRVI